MSRGQQYRSPTNGCRFSANGGLGEPWTVVTSMPRVEEKKEKTNNFKKPAKQTGERRHRTLFCFKSVVLSQNSGSQERGDKEFHKKRGLYLQKAYTTNGETHGMTFTHDV